MAVREIPVAIRVHSERSNIKEKPAYHKKGRQEDLRKPYGQRVMVIDTETTTDIYQNLLFGQAIVVEGSRQVYVDGLIVAHYVIMADNLPDNEQKTLNDFAREKGATLVTRKDFIDKVFLPEIWELGTVCIGFNLPFDLSRLAIKARTFKQGKHKDEFELTLSENKNMPTILIHPIDSKKAFIQFRFPTRPKRQSRRIPYRQGRFIDLKTLVFALTNESHSLASACKLYKVEHGKTQAEEHGKITAEYIQYNYNDVIATFELYCKAKEEFDKHPINLEAGKAYSPASIGKAYYEAMGIKPFLEKQPDFPREYLGYAMAAYYGGRSECHYRNKPVKVFHTDVTSMYPSVFTLQDLWSWVIADKLEMVEATAEIKAFLERLTLEQLFHKSTWLQIPGLVLVKPDKTLLPVRAKYNSDSGYQIGLNYLSADKPMWYTLADLISCKILSGKISEIVRAYRIIPCGVQPGLKPVKLQDEVEINPDTDNFFKKVIETRKQIKKEMKKYPKDSQEYERLYSLQLFLKILANSTSYGVYIEVNREKEDSEQKLQVYGLDNFIDEDNNLELTGKYYNPLIAVMITGAARLILAMIEKRVIDLGGSYAFCDTDSMSIINLKNDRPEIIGRKVVEEFKTLYPYDDNPDGSLLEAEEYNWQLENPLDANSKPVANKYFPLYCYMVSAKRYVLYNLVKDDNGQLQVIIRKKTDHGLGHLMSPLPGDYQKKWIEEIWRSIISKEHGLPYSFPAWYRQPALAQLSISKPAIYDKVNKDDKQPYCQQVKPFNFIVVAYPAKQLLHLPTIKDYYCAQYRKLVHDGKVCREKSSCKYKDTCLSGIHIMPIAPFDNLDNWQGLAWQDKTTKMPLQVVLKEYEDDDLSVQATITDNKIRIKAYADFIKPYSKHPELKYDGPTGEPCQSDTQGELKRTHVKATKIVYIGKEANTLQDVEERAILPEENDDFVLEYSPKGKAKAVKRNRQPEIGLQQWAAMIKPLDQLARPRQRYADLLNISKRQLLMLLKRQRNPSKELYEKICQLFKDNGIAIPKPNPVKLKFPVSDKWYPLSYYCQKYHLSKEKILQDVKDARIKSGMEELRGEIYLLEGSLQKKGLIEHWRQQKNTAYPLPEKLMIKAIRLSDGQEVELNPEAIEAVQVYREQGKNYYFLHIKVKDDDNIYRVLQKNNRLLFACHILPKPKELLTRLSSQDNKAVMSKRKTKTHNYEVSNWLPYKELLNSNQINGIYRLKGNRVIEDVEKGLFAKEEYVIAADGQVWLTPLAAYRFYHNLSRQ